LGGKVSIGSQYRPVNTLEVIDVSSLGSEKIDNTSFVSTPNPSTFNTTDWTWNAENYMDKDADGTNALSQASSSMLTPPIVGQYYQVSWQVGSWTDDTQTFTAAVDDTITSTAHGLSNGNLVLLTTTVTLPAPFALSTPYYVINSAANTFKLSASIVISFGGVSNTIYLAEFWTSFLETPARQTFIKVIKATSDTGISFTPSNTSRFLIDNVSIKQITGGDLYVNKQIKTAGDVYITTSTRGIILTSPDNSCARGTIDNLDVLTFASITCP